MERPLVVLVCSSQLNGLFRSQHNHSVKAMQAEIAAALRRTGAYLSRLGRLKLGVTSRARAEAPLSGIKIQVKVGATCFNVRVGA